MAEKFNEADVLALWRCARKHNSSIPDEALNAMRKTLLDTLRQQAGRVDASVIEALDHIVGLSSALRSGGPDPMDLQELSDALHDAVDTAHNTRAALAQNTQGEGEPVAEVYEYPRDHHEPVPVMLKGIRFTDMPLPVGTKLYLHAERARVPELDELLREMVDLHDKRECVLTVHMDRLKDLLAAAPSQRAEVDRG